MKNVNTNAHPAKGPDPSGWYFLVEIPIREWMPDDGFKGELSMKFLFQMVRELGIPPECAENIETVLAGFIREAYMHTGQERSGLPGSICVFCQKKRISSVDATRPAQTEQTGHELEPAQQTRSPGTKVSAGWGYFLVERSAASNGSSGRHTQGINLYLYQEGE